MLTKLIIRNFKKFDSVEIELGNPVVLIGPNNAGKTTALQALALWEIGLRRWVERRKTGRSTGRRSSVTLNRHDLSAAPVPAVALFWRDLQVRNAAANGKQRAEAVQIEVIVHGVNGEEAWQCGFAFDYANEESFYCRLLLNDKRQNDKSQNDKSQDVPSAALETKVAFLPPMSGLAANETRLEPGAINVRIGEGRTAEVLRNLCYAVLMGPNGEQSWHGIATRITKLFGIFLEKPRYLPERGEITLSYRTAQNTLLDISAAGRGLQQTLLLLAHIEANPGRVLLLDEPDAHLEILRQRQTYQLLSEMALARNSQLIIASHSEVILNEAADRDVVVAFVGTPHRIDDRGGQLLKALKEIGFEHYYQAEQRGWVLYLEGSTDLAILRALAQTLQHPAQAVLESPFVHYVYNQPMRVRDHFYALLEAKPNLVGFALFDQLERPLPAPGHVTEYMWRRREMENYLCQRDVLLRWAAQAGSQSDDPSSVGRWQALMSATIDSLVDALARLRRGSPWEADLKVTDEFLDPLFADFYQQLGLPNLMRKTDYHLLAKHLAREEIDPEVTTVLDSIYHVAQSAQPVTGNL